MASTETLTVRLAPQEKALLARLAQETQRSKAFLAAEAIRAYVARESGIVEGLLEGLADLEAGRIVPHEEAVASFEETIRKTAKKTKKMPARETR